VKLPLASERNLGNLGNLFFDANYKSRKSARKRANLGNGFRLRRKFVSSDFKIQLSTFNFQLFLIGFLLEAVAVDDEAFVSAFADEAALVVGVDAEQESSTVDFDQFAVAPYAHSDGSGSAVADVDAGAHGALSCVEVWRNALVASAFYKCYHHRCGENFNQPAAYAVGAELVGDGLFEVSFYSFFYHFSN